MSLKRSHTQQQELFRRRRRRSQGRSAGALRRAQAHGSQQRGVHARRHRRCRSAPASRRSRRRCSAWPPRATSRRSRPASTGRRGWPTSAQAEFLKAFARASRVDSTRQRDLSEIARLKQNNDTMRQRLLTAIAERDHYLAALKKHGIDPGPAPVPAAPAPAPRRPRPARQPPVRQRPGPQALAVPSPASEDAPSGPGDAGGHGSGLDRNADRERPAEPRARGHAGHADPARRGGRRRAPRRAARADRARAGRRAPASGGRWRGGACDFSLIVTSPLVRAVQTAEIVAAATRLPRPHRRRPICCVPEGAASRVVSFSARGRSRTEGSPSIALVAHEPILSARRGRADGQGAPPAAAQGGGAAHPARRAAPTAKGALRWRVDARGRAASGYEKSAACA